MRRWLLVAFVLLAAGVGVFTYTYNVAPSSPSPSRASTVAPDAVALSGFGGAAGSSPMLGMGSGTSDILDSRMAGTLRAAHIGVLRFGDIGADDYDWQGGCIYGDIGSRPECYGIAGQGGKLDQFLTFAGQVGAQPLIVVNGEVDDPQQAAGLVAYYWLHCVHAAGKLCPDPYWEIGDSPASWKHFAVPLARRQPSDAQVIQPDQYAALAIAYAAAMTQATPSYVTRANKDYKLKIVADEWITGATDQSWVDSVVAVDTHYAPLLYAPPGPPPSEQDVIGAVEHGYGGRPGLDAWLQDLRDSLAQFSQSGSIGIILGRWSIDTNISSVEPAVYGGYAQALFTAQMIAHVWQDAQGGGRNPMLMVVQSPITGQAQEPFDITSLQPRPAVSVYTLVDRYFASYPLLVQRGDAARRGGVVAAAALAGTHDARVLLINTNRDHARTVDLQGMTAGAYDMWWIAPDRSAPTGVSAIHHERVSGARVTVPPWAIAVVRGA